MYLKFGIPGNKRLYTEKSHRGIGRYEGKSFAFYHKDNRIVRLTCILQKFPDRLFNNLLQQGYKDTTFFLFSRKISHKQFQNKIYKMGLKWRSCAMYDHINDSIHSLI